MIFDELDLWLDPIPRSGPEAMAVDEWLLHHRQTPLLRVYAWEGKWGSVGYFGKLVEAQARIPEREWVRRWTGGGTVDHSDDWTYSLIVPKGHPFAELKGGESYRLIHEILIAVLTAEGSPPKLSHGREKNSGLCFENPVEHDIEDSTGTKLAGAAQRRSRLGLLHQGSVKCSGNSRLRAEIFTESLSKSWSEQEIFVDSGRIEELLTKKYGTRDWLERA